MKNFIKIFALCLTFACSVSLISGCSVKEAVIEEEIYALDTLINLKVYSDSQEAVNLAKSEIRRLESLLSVTDANSDISKINSSPDIFVKVSDECFELISTAIDISENTGGSFDITVYPAVKLWGFTTSTYKVPSETELLEVNKLIGYNKIELAPDTKSVKIPKGTSLDLGGIAKGYISDKASQVLKEHKVNSAVLNLGGNIRLVGSKPQDESYNIGIKSPFNNGQFGILKVKDVNVSTAGGYERYFEENGRRYHHILNPYTASPADTDVLSATVIGEKGEVCDALSTAAVVMGSQKLKDISANYPDYSFIVLTENSVFVSENTASDFELADNFKDYKINVI